MPCDANSRRRWATALLCAAWGVFWAWPVRAQVVTLRSVEKKALAHRASLGAEHAKANRARAEIELARAARYPDLTFKTDAALAPGNSLIVVRDTTGHEYRVLGSRPLGNSGAFTPEPRYGASIALQGPLYDFGRTENRVEAAKAGFRAAQADEGAARAAIVRQVQAAYLDWTVALGEERIAQRAAANAKARREATEGYVQEGKRPPSDLLTARVEEAQSRLDLVEAQGRVTTARLALERAAAVSLPRSAAPEPGLLDMAPPTGKARPTPALVALERRRDAADATARAHAHTWAPVLSGMVEAGVYGQKRTVFPSYRAGITLSVPLWDGGSENAREEAARATADELSAEETDLHRSLSNAEATARADWQNASTRVKVAKQFLSAARAALDATEQRYELGDGSVEDVIKARAQVDQAALRLLHARAARTDAALRLRNLANGGS